MENAALNTLLGMGTVFVVLILISMIIYLFSFMPKIEAAMKKKKEQTETVVVDQTIAQIIEKEELSDDCELVAVISAAIAAYENENGGSGDGYVVRTIRKRR
jgi:sodium pump decarboxylase gamma subunit